MHAQMNNEKLNRKKTGKKTATIYKQTQIPSIQVYHYHSPPVEGLIRLPPVLWARLRHELREYLSERRSHTKTTLSWYHRQFIEAASERYAGEEQARVLHCGLAEYYQAEEGVQKDITLSRRKLTIPDADRQVKDGIDSLGQARIQNI